MFRENKVSKVFLISLGSNRGEYFDSNEHMNLANYSVKNGSYCLRVKYEYITGFNSYRFK